jgi:uncharacterized membrane protein
VIPEKCRVPGTHSSRAIGAIYISPALAICWILTLAFEHKGEHSIRAWLMQNMGMAFWLGTFAIVGLLSLLRPAIIIRWAKHSYPDLSPEDRRGLLIVRVIGAALLVFSFIGLAKL